MGKRRHINQVCGRCSYLTANCGSQEQAGATFGRLPRIVRNCWCLVCCLLLSANCLLPITRYSYIPKEIPRDGSGNLDINQAIRWNVGARQHDLQIICR